MKILITGSKGFIGQNLVNHLKDEHEIQVYDILDGYKRPKELSLKGIDKVIHLGAISSTIEKDIQKIMDLNVSWAIELFEECVSKRIDFQWSSSASVYGRETTTFRENQPMRPDSLYAKSKMLLENYITSHSQQDITWQGFRYFNVYGKHEDHKDGQASPYHQFTKQAIDTGIIRIFEGSENFLRDFISVENVCEYHERFLKEKVCGIFNIGSGKPKSFSQVAEEIAEKYSAKIEVIPFPSYLRNQYQTYTCADLTLVDTVLQHGNIF
jgi:ADP-L-glycero-D-manno-heptose 6-epimerase